MYISGITGAMMLEFKYNQTIPVPHRKPLTLLQAALKRLLNPKTIELLRPRSDLGQFGMNRSFVKGLEHVSQLWKSEFTINAVGLKRAFWAADATDLENVRIDSRAC